MSARSRNRQRSNGRPTRRSQRRPEKSTVLVVCEGRETERNYFEGLKRDETVARHFTVTVKRGAGGSRPQIVQRAVKYSKDDLRDFDETWCVMDVERLENESARAELRNAIELARDNHIRLCLSNPAVEVWFLAHFLRTSQCFHDCDAVINELNKHWRATFQSDYLKNDDRIYARLDSRTKTAIQNAEDVLTHDHGNDSDVVLCNSSTNVYELVEKLIGFRATSN